MVIRIKAVYRDGVFFPQDPCALPQNSTVDLIFESPTVERAPIQDPEERRLRLRILVERMTAHPFSANAPVKLTRDEMHERR